MVDVESRSSRRWAGVIKQGGDGGEYEGPPVARSIRRKEVSPALMAKWRV